MHTYIHYIHTYITLHDMTLHYIALHCIALLCITLHTYIHTTTTGASYPPIPWGWEHGTRDHIYIYIYTVYTELSSAMIDQMLIILYPQHIPKTGWFIQGGAPSLFTLESRTEVCKSTNITGGQHMATHYTYSWNELYSTHAIYKQPYLS